MKNTTIGERVLQNKPVRLDEMVAEFKCGRRLVRAMSFMAWFTIENQTIQRAKRRQAASAQNRLGGRV